MPIQAFATDKAPAPVGPYSQVVRAGDFIFTAGQIPLDPVSGALVTGDIKAATRQTILNLLAVLEAAGAKPAHVVSVMIYVADINDFDRINEVYAEFFGDVMPTRALIQAAALPKGAALEMQAVAYVGG